MFLILAQIAVGTAVWFALGSVHWGFKICAVFVEFVVVDQIWVRLFQDPFLQLGAMQIAKDDPLMLAAMDQGRSTFAKFLEIYPEHKTDSAVRFAFETDVGTVENLWGDLLEIDDAQATVYLRTPPIDHEGELERKMVVGRDKIHDWQIEFRDGTLRGAYTVLAMFKIFQREQGHLPPQLVTQMQRFKEIDW